MIVHGCARVFSALMSRYQIKDASEQQFPAEQGLKCASIAAKRTEMNQGSGYYVP